MSSFIGGYNTGYSSIAPYRLYLNLSEDDKEFATNAYSAIKLNEDIYQKPDLTIIPDFHVTNKNSLWGVIQSDVTLSKFVLFIKKFNLQRFLNDFDQSYNNQFTLFAPVNDYMDYLLQLIETTVLTPETILRYHMLDFPILPVEMMSRKLRIPTKMRNKYIVMDNLKIVQENDNTFPNYVLSSQKTDNGYLYKLQYPLVPDIN